MRLGHVAPSRRAWSLSKDLRSIYETVHPILGVDDPIIRIGLPRGVIIARLCVGRTAISTLPIVLTCMMYHRIVSVHGANRAILLHLGSMDMTDLAHASSTPHVQRSVHAFDWAAISPQE